MPHARPCHLHTGEVPLELGSTRKRVTENGGTQLCRTLPLASHASASHRAHACCCCCCCSHACAHVLMQVKAMHFIPLEVWVDGVGGRRGSATWMTAWTVMNFQRGTTWADIRRELTAWTDGVS